MYLPFSVEQHLCSLINRAKDKAQRNCNGAASMEAGIELKKELSSQFDFFNYFNQIQASCERNFYTLDNVKIVDHVERSSHKKQNHYKLYTGAALTLVGQPIIKKRFVMQGASAGTSIASKYLSMYLPQKMPIRILGTTVLGRAIGRAVPYIGEILIAIDVIELLIEEFEAKEFDQQLFGGFKGGSGGGAGALGTW